ncbi:MAG: phenylalanine--tRNA ligase subunit beta [Candidatus Saccharimonadales bacterium]
MKVSLDWAQQYSNVNLNPNGVEDLVTKIGAQLGAVEEVTEWGPRYDGAVVARVVTCEKHPNADKLNVCWVDDGGVTSGIDRNPEGQVQVVCGAPNVRAGLSVVWLPPGATVPSTYGKEPFVLGARELRGVVSNGMLASASELGISDDHTGILEIDPNEVDEELVKPGTPFKKLYGLDDVIIDIENKMFTHRPDCFGILGVAREIAGIQHQAFQSSDWYLQNPEFAEANQLSLAVINEIPELVPRFMAVAMSNVQIKPSPVWLQVALAKVGIKSINNVVDVTNYLMHLTAQPLHAYDYDKVAARSSNGAVLSARLPKEGETLALLNGKTLAPRPEAIMIATDQELVGVGGVMGGAGTEVDENTKNIIIECASFDMYSIRRTSMAHGLFTDAVTRFNKGQSPLQNNRVIAKAMKFMGELAGAEQASNVIDDEHLTNNHDPVLVDVEFINARLGLQLDAAQITDLLTGVEFEVDPAAGPLSVTAPFWRTDIAIPEDIVEEVGRLYGFEKLPLELPKRSATPTKLDPQLALKQRLRQTLASFGANEVLTYSFVHGNLLEKVGQNKELAFKLTNALSPDLQYYRISLTPSLLTHVHPNVKAGYDRFSLFEVNKTHITIHKDDDSGVPSEISMLTLVTTDKSRTDAAYYTARTYLDRLVESFGARLHYEPIKDVLDHQVTAPFDHTRSALVSVAGTDIFLGIVGEYKQTVKKSLKLPVFSAGFEINPDQLLKIKPASSYTPLSRYPSISQDICLEVSSTMPYGQLTDALEEQLQSQASLDQVIKQQALDIYQSSDNPERKRVTYHITLTSYERTLTDEVLSKLLTVTADALGQSFGARRI